jgi:hypothetical protein
VFGVTKCTDSTFDTLCRGTRPSSADPGGVGKIVGGRGSSGGSRAGRPSPKYRNGQRGPSEVRGMTDPPGGL